MHDQLLFIIMCQNEIKTKRKWHIDSCSLAPVCVFSRSAKFSPCDPPARLQRDFILQSRDGRRPTGSRHLESLVFSGRLYISFVGRFSLRLCTSLLFPCHALVDNQQLLQQFLKQSLMCPGFVHVHTGRNNTS